MASGGGAVKMITLMGSDKEEVVVEEVAAMMSQTLRYMIEDNYGDDIIPIPNVTGAVLSKVFYYCKKHAGEVASRDEFISTCHDDLNEFDECFVNVDVSTIHALLMAANYLEVKGLLELACKKLADIIKGKSPEEIRETFNIKNDFTPKEEAEFRKQNAWAFN